MATCLQVPMVVPSTLLPSSSTSSSSFGMNGWRNVTKRRLNYRCSSSSSSKISLPPIDPDDPFMKRLTAHFEDNPDLEPTPNSQYPPFSDFLQQQPLIEARGGRRKYGQGRFKTTIPPPDLASKIFDARIVYLGLPLVDLVAELIMAELMFLSWVDDKSPIYLYINCTGSAGEDGQTVAHGANGLCIYDTMTLIKADVETVCIGACDDYACLLLAAGKIGKRFMMPQSRISMKVPPVAGTGLMHSSKVFSQAKQAQIYRDQLFKLFAYNTGHRLDDIKEKLEHPLNMGPKEALEFSVVDKILCRGSKDTVAEQLKMTPEQLDKQSLRRGGKAVFFET